MADTGSRITANAQAGQFFSITYYPDVPSSPIERRLVFENPAANKKTMYLENVSGGIWITPGTTPRDDYQATLDVFIAEVDNITRGPTLTPVNFNLGSSIASTIIASHSPVDYHLTKDLYDTTHPTGEYSLNFGGKIIVPPGHILFISLVSNESDIRGVLSITVIWYELEHEQGDGIL